MSASGAVLLDCRWLRVGGAGRLTELLLRGLAAEPPDEPWRLWGVRAALEPLAWEGAEIVHEPQDPRARLGQGARRRVPSAGVAVFMHHQRPLVRRPASVTVVLDTIALHFAPNALVREAKRAFLKAVVRSSSSVLTISEHSRASIAADLGIRANAIGMLAPPFDDAFVERLALLRGTVEREENLLYVGNAMPHKNLPRLLAAFRQTELCRDGGTLTIAGGSAAEAGRLRAEVDQRGWREVKVVGPCSQDELDRLYASSRALIQPSLEEGFGLPVWEAAMAGLPVCVSDGGSLAELAGPLTTPFPATSVSAMTEAIDATVAIARRAGPDDAENLVAVARESRPTIAEFTATLRAAVKGVAAAPV